MTELEANKLIHFEEPKLMFGHGQVLENPKDGLMLFGPLISKSSPKELRIGIVGTTKGIPRYHKWVSKINGYIPAERNDAAHHVPYPGFEAIFSSKWPSEPVCTLPISLSSIEQNLFIEDKHEAIFNTVELFVEEIKRYIREEDTHVDLWFVVIPEIIYTYGRPKSVIPKEMREKSSLLMNFKTAKRLQKEPDLFSGHNEAAEVYKYEVHFHNQLKARLLEDKAVIQVVRETSLTPEEFKKDDGTPVRKLQDPASLAWNITTAAYFKASGRPWKLANIREGVCYIGLVFKRDMTSLVAGNACCGAQMFLDSGDGLVFKGAVGPWYSEETGEYHLPQGKAKHLIGTVIQAYKRVHGIYPKELFIHGRTRFNDDEWNGFLEAVTEETNLVGVRIREDKTMKLYPKGRIPVLRGTANIISKRRGYLWTRGYVPRLETYAGREVPNPLLIEICRGWSDITQVMEDIMGLTKVNFNSCIFADGRPVTLRFADSVGDILTATPEANSLPPLPFKHYI